MCWTQVSAQTLYVPSGEYSSIQSAINDANNGDTIIVSAGIYLENISFLGKAVTVRSADPNDPNVVAATIIDGSNPVDPNIGSVVTFNHNEGPNSVLAGFTIQNGSGQTDPTVTWRIWTGNNGDGGGALCSGASPTITKNVFKNCTAQYGGGGIFCHKNASPVITHNTFLNNYAVWYGGGVFARLYCSPTISNNTFIQNQCKYLGGAVYLADHCYSKVTNNWFEENDSEVLYAGAIYYFVSAAPVIACNFFIANTAQTTGSAMNMNANSSGIVINNYFEGNATRTSGGSAIRVSSGGYDLIANNIIVENIGVGLSNESGSAPIVKNNNVWGNTVSNYGGVMGDQTGINGNISGDPKIAPQVPELPEPLNAFSFYELDYNSPCINAGDNSSVPLWLTSDYDATSRIFNGVVDMGPQEYHSLRVPQDFNKIQQAVDAAQSGDEIIVSPGFYRENVDFLDKNIRLRSPNPLDANCVAQTIIDGNDANSCIKILSGQDDSTAVAGFWIQNGRGQFGGGIHVGNSVGPVLMYNYITNNTAFKPEGATTGGYGGGIDCRNNSYAEVLNNTIIDNYAEVAGGGVHIGPGSSCLIQNNSILENRTIGEAGGGIYCYNKTTAWIINNEIIGNTAETAYGGGIWVWESPEGIIEDNIIIGNASLGGDGRGGGIGMMRASMLIRNNLICGNRATKGGGVWIQYEGKSKVINNTIVGNIADLEGGGIEVAWDVNSPIINNIIANNGPGGIYVKSSGTMPSDPNLIANDLWNNDGGNYLGDINDLTGVAGNISADPCFVDAGCWDSNSTPEDPNDDFWVQGDYQIGYLSPCRDGGSPDDNEVPEVDIAGNPRPHFAGFDIGAYELQTYDLIANGSVDLIDLSLLAEFWLAEGPSLPADLDDSGIVDFRDFALFSSDWLK